MKPFLQTHPESLEQIALEPQDESTHVRSSAPQTSYGFPTVPELQMQAVAPFSWYSQ
jgi:hypothetical protein